MFLGQKNHADAVFAGCGQLHILLRKLVAIKLVRNLDQDASAVPAQRVCTNGTAMVQILENRQALQDDFVAFLTFDMRNKPYAAGIVFPRLVIQAVGLQILQFGWAGMLGCVHDQSLSCQ
jgi:hypothetical protein